VSGPQEAIMSDAQLNFKEGKYFNDWNTNKK